MTQRPTLETCPNCGSTDPNKHPAGRDLETGQVIGWAVCSRPEHIRCVHAWHDALPRRLTPERLAGLRQDSVSSYVPFDHRADLCDLLAELDAVRAERDEARAEAERLNDNLLAYWGTYGAVPADNGRYQAMLAEAEQRGRAAERSAAVAYLRALNYEHVPSMLERGDHVRKGGSDG